MIFINRYRDRFRFELDSDGNVLWTGEFNHCRYGHPNDYTEAYSKYVEDDCDSSSVMTVGEFKTAVHESNDHGYTDFARKYMHYVKSDTSVIDMVDPSGGPYVSRETDLGYVADELKGMKPERFERIDDNTWKIITKKDDSRSSGSHGEQ